MRFLAVRRAAGYREPRSVTGLRPLLDYLGGLGLLPAQSRRPTPNAAGAPISEFTQYLRTQRGLAPMTLVADSSRPPGSSHAALLTRIPAVRRGGARLRLDAISWRRARKGGCSRDSPTSWSS